VLRRREQVNRGAVGRPIAHRDVVEKFHANAELARISESSAQRVVDAVLDLDRCRDVAELAAFLAEAAPGPT
jgi:hypothetical protein